MKKFIKLFVFFSFFLVVSLAFTKSKSVFILGDPIPGVDVSLEQIPGGVKGITQTDANGYYTFKNVSKGVYNIYFGPRKSVKGSVKNKMNRKKGKTNQQKFNKGPHDNSTGIIIYAEDFNSSRSNLSNITSPKDKSPLITTKLTNHRLDLKRTKIRVGIKLTKSVNVLKGRLTH